MTPCSYFRDKIPVIIYAGGKKIVTHTLNLLFLYAILIVVYGLKV